MARRHRLTITARVRVSVPARALVDIDVFDPAGHRVLRRAYDGISFKAGVMRTFRPTFYVASTGRLGTYVVKIRIYRVGWAGLLKNYSRSATFRVHR